MGGLGLVGRDGELRRVHRSLAVASAGTGRFVLIAGEPGIGKSRLASEAVQLARQQGFRSAWGSCRETEGAPPYWPWTQALRAALDPTLASQPMLTALLNPEASGANVETDRFRLFDHASQALVAAASTQPLLVVFDDLHRADDASITLLRFLVLSVREAAIVLLGTYRDTEAPATHPLSCLVAEVAGSEQFELIELSGLSESATEELARSIGSTLTRAELVAVHHRCGGNPLLLTELLRLGSGQLDKIPATVDAAVRARVGLLPESTRQMLTLAAVLGRDITVEILAVVAGCPTWVVTEQLSAAVEARLVTPDTEQHVGAYRFSHVLVQQALYGALGPVRRVQLHDRAAAVLEQLVDTDPTHVADLARHAAQAIELPRGRQRAYKSACRAARTAEGRLADDDAARWYHQALAHAPSEDRAMLLLKLGRSAGRAGHVAQARAAFEQAWSLAAERNQEPVLAEAALGLGEVIISVGTVDARLVRMLERTLALTSADDPATAARLTARLATELYWGDGLERGRQLAAHAVSVARGLNDKRTLADALAAHQFVLRGPDNLAERISMGKELVRLAATLHDEAMELLGRRVLVPDLLQCDRVAADDQLTQLAALAAEPGRPLARWYALLYRALCATFTGQRADAHTLVDQAEALGHQLQAQPAALYGTGQRFLLLRQAGRAAEAENAVRHQAARWPALLTFQCIIALLLADTGRADEAIALLDDLLPGRNSAAPRDSLWLANTAMLAEAAARLGHADHAAAAHQALAPYAGRIAVQGVTGWLGAVDHYLALTSTTLGNWDEAETRFRAALTLHQAWGATPFITATLRGYADMLRRRDRPGDRQRAARLMPAQIRPAEVNFSGSAPLTDREQQVLRLLADGASNKEIARQLTLSVHTVERHIANIYSKIGVRNRAEATAYALNAAR